MGCECADTPIACSLGAEDATARVGEWRSLLAGVVGRGAIDGGLRLEFGAGSDIGDIARLAAAEQACCPFFSFAVTVDQRGVGLEVRAPEEGQEVLDGLFAEAGTEEATASS